MNQDHANLVERLSKPGPRIILDLTPKTAHLLHMIVGLAGEVGELLDTIKKHSIYCKDLDLDNVIEELGDIEFYLEGIRATLGIERDETIEHNIIKLSTRYGQEYSNQAAIERVDKA
jgi:NTP pyrophosphatase (non-canonical NTP hydrolase)